MNNVEIKQHLSFYQIWRGNNVSIPKSILHIHNHSETWINTTLPNESISFFFLQNMLQLVTTVTR